jgi:hypothetical protein
MIGKASEIKTHVISWWPGFELGRPSLSDLVNEWLYKHPNFEVVNITWNFEESGKQAYIIYKEGEYA